MGRAAKLLLDCQSALLGTYDRPLVEYLKRDQILSAFLRAAGDRMTRIRFDMAIRNAIRDQQQSGRRMMSMGTDLFAQQPASKQPAHAAKRGMLFLLRPVKLLARYIRRFLVGQLEAKIEALRLELIQSRTVTQQLMNAMHAEVEDIALRSRGVLAVDDATFALRTYDGFVFVPRQDTMLLLMALDAGPQGLEPGTRRVLTKVLAPGMTFIDIGANVGLLTLAGARAVGPSGKVLAFEPVPLSFDLLSWALAINGLIHRVEAKRQAVGARRERCKFFVRNVLGHSYSSDQMHCLLPSQWKLKLMFHRSMSWCNRARALTLSRSMSRERNLPYSKA